MKYEITIADNAGFCFGVDRALKIVYNSIEAGEKVVTYGEMIHNRDVTAELERQGVRVVNTPEELARLTDETVIIRSHGVPADIFRLLEEKGIKYRDGTCPYVKRVHKIVEEKSAAGYGIIIMGDENHPEVQGIAGNSHILPEICKEKEDLVYVLEKNYKNSKKKVAIVAQTTYNISKWDNCARAAKDVCPGAEIIGTVCKASRERQKSAETLARKVDLMIVVGGRHSSNTAKLAEVCQSSCKACVYVENAGDPELGNIPVPDNTGEIFSVGITAGASVPAYIIKEVSNQMNEKLQNMDEDFNFEEALDASFKKIYTGQRVKGYITAVNDAEAVVDVGTKHTGYVSLDELTDDSSLKPIDVVKPGDEVDLMVLKVNDAEGIVNLSKKKIDAQKGFEEILRAKEDGTVLEGTVNREVKGGVTVFYEGTRVFIPASLASSRRDENLAELVKKTVRFRIIDVNEQRGTAVGSIKAVLSAEKEAAKEKFWDTVQVGDVFKGEVKSLTNYGAFVDLGGIDGMVHISELSWNRIKHPSEVVKVGDVIEVYIKDLDREADRISLGYKKEADNPWRKFAEDYQVGDVVKAKVVSITPFGAFAQIVPGIDGLIHISQVAEKRVTNVKDALSVGDEVEAKITEIDVDKKRISISIKELLEDRAGEVPEDEGTEE